jgi:hypothetical protein
MGDKQRLSIASSSGLKGTAVTAAQFKRVFNRQTPSSLSKYSFLQLDFSRFHLSLVSMKIKRNELNLKIY